MTARQYRSQFAEPGGYLDFARFGPVSAVVADRLADCARLIHTEGLSALEVLDAWTREAAEATATLLAAAPHEVAFVGSTSHGLFAAAYALSGPAGPSSLGGSGGSGGSGGPDGPDGVVLVPRTDFPANVYPWLREIGRASCRERVLNLV